MGLDADSNHTTRPSVNNRPISGANSMSFPFGISMNRLPLVRSVPVV